MLNALVTLAAEPAGEAAKNPLIPAWYDIIWSGVCFLVIIFVVWRVALPRMAKLLDERSAAIEGNIAKADEAQRQAEAALEQYTAQLAEARKEAGEIRGFFAFTLFEIFVAFLQAYVFAILTAVYIQLAVAEEH